MHCGFVDKTEQDVERRGKTGQYVIIRFVLPHLAPFCPVLPHHQKTMDVIRVSVSEAARLFGVSQKTVRRALAEGDLVYVVVRGRYKISFESLIRWSQKRPHVKNKLAKEGIGQFVEQWKIRNRLYSPNPKVLKKEKV